MYTCDECVDRLLDFLYGLLEPEDVQRLREHLANCPPCQAALAQAQAQQGLLARAAHFAREVPAFVAPSESGIKEIATSPSPELAPTQSADTGTVTLQLAAPTRRVTRRWPWLATAAALLLLAGGLYWSYEDGLQSRQADLARAQGEIARVEVRYANGARGYYLDLARLPAQLKAREVGVQVTGAAAYQGDAPSQVRVVTQDVNGVPAGAHLQVGVLDPTGKKMVFLQEFESGGDKAVVLPPGLKLKPGEGAQLVVKAATTRGAEAEIREALATAEPTFDTHVALDKPAYRAGEVVFFRTLTLDRFSSRPPAREIPLTFTLRDARNVAVKELQGKTRPDGIGGGELALSGLPAGADYTLEVTPVAAASGVRERVQPRTCRFTVVQDEPARYAGFGAGNAATNTFFFERNTYAPGDTVRGEFRQQRTGGVAANQSVQVNARQANGQTIPIDGAPKGKPLQTVTDAQGRANFGLQLPKDIGPGPPVVEVEVADGKTNARYKQDIPVAPAHPVVEFFPEGGDLAAGVTNRVYFLAQTPQGAPADVDGRVLDRQGKEVARVQRMDDGGPAGPRGSGSFTFTPRAAETYTLQYDVSPKTQKVVPLPPVHTAGVALNVPEAVSREGDDIRAVVRSSAPERQLLVLATCRGHVVDQQFVSASPGGTEVRLSPVPGTRGVVRLTTYEVRESQLLPRAERLLYQIPAERLVLTCADVGKGTARTYRTAEHVNLGIKAVDEKGAPADATFLAAVVNERSLPPGQQAEQGPPAFFYLTSEVQNGADLENADFLVSDTPQARAALDLFLGTQGWRRFSDGEAAPLLAKSTDLGATTALADQPAVFRRDNFDEVAARYDAALVTRREELRRQTLQERESLQDERDRGVAAAGLATACLADYQDLPRRVLRMAAAVGVLLLLATGGVLLIVGFVRTVRGGRPTAAFAGAFTSLLLCLAIYGATGDLRQPDRGGPDDGQQARLSPRQLPSLPEMAPAANPKPAAKSQDRAGPVGRFLEVKDQKSALSAADGATRERMARAGAKDMTTRDDAWRRAMLEEQLSKGKAVELQKNALEQAAKGGLSRSQQEPGRLKSEMLVPAGGSAPAAASAPAMTPSSPATKKAPEAAPSPPALNPVRATPNPTSDPASTAATSADKADRPATLALRHYAYREAGRPGGISPDTVLWYPALVALDGTARIDFDLSGQPTTYRVLLYAHSPSGRLGAYRGQLEARK